MLKTTAVGYREGILWYQLVIRLSIFIDFHRA